MTGADLAGRTAIITGAASGIGASIANAFGREGAQLLLADRDAGRLAATVKGLAGTAEVRLKAIDVTDETQVGAMVADCLDAFGRADVLVNCAGMVQEVPFLEMTTADWDTMIEVDLRSVFLCSRAVAPRMVGQGWGRIINLASQLGIKGGTNVAHYVAAKAAVIGLTKALARELAPAGVLVNAIAPGPIETPLIRNLSDKWRRAKEAELPLGRFGLPSEVAPTAVLLASDPGGNLFVGQVLGPNSGDVMP